MARVESDIPVSVHSITKTNESQAKSYCTECCEKILPWKRLDSYNYHVQNFHHDLSDLVECGKQCELCGYICSLFGQAVLQNISPQTAHDGAPAVQVIQRTSDSRVDRHGNLEHLLMSIDIRKSRTEILAQREFTVYTSAGRAFGRPIWSAPNLVDFEARSSTIREWLTECKTHHPNCRKTLDSNSSFASRILKVRSLERGLFGVKIVGTQGLDLHSEDYVVLSHVWGGIDIPCKTTRHNIQQYEDNIQFEVLPKTFRDAIQICVNVGISYLWLDSLCIIQDDLQDWQRESAKMASIYRGASLTISATSSQNCHGGCGVSSTLEPATHFDRSPEYPLNFAIRGPEYADTRSKEGVQRQMKEAPINARAWIFQEKLLSRRILHAAQAQFVWQCATHTESEDGIHYRKGRKGGTASWGLLDSQIVPEVSELLSIPVKTRYELERRWWSWVRDYMRRNLKQAGDQYAAFAGAVRLYQEMTADEPVVGLWKENLCMHLAWQAYREGCVADRNPSLAVVLGRQGRVPSWTWMSYLHGSVGVSEPDVDWESLVELPTDDGMGIVYKAEIVQTEVSWDGEPLTSVPSGTITIRGICDRLPRPTGRGLSHGGIMSLDPGIPSNIGKEEFHVIALLAYTRKGYLINSKPTVTTICLILFPAASPEEAKYIRIGVMKLNRDISSTEGLECQPKGACRTLTLV